MSEKKEANKKSSRILSVDVLRVITIVLMIFVDKAIGDQYEFTKHAMWNGLNLADFVFPSFVTLMGVSMYFSLSKYEFSANKSAVFKIIRRFVLLCIFGWIIAQISNSISASFEGKNFFEAFFDFSQWRPMGIFTRLALCYLVAGLIVLFVHNKKALIGIIVALLVGYIVILGFGNGYEQSEANIISIVDKTIFTPDHMYKMKIDGGAKIALDPEGLLSTIPCIAQTLLGFLVGGLIKDKTKDNKTKVLYMFIIGYSLLITGYILGLFVPPFKKAWTSSFVLLTSGVVFCMLALLTWIIDIKKHNKWCKFFQIYGTNALVSFAAMDCVWLLIIKTGCPLAFYNFIAPAFFGFEGVASLITSVPFILLLWLLLYFLDKKKIYIRF